MSITVEIARALCAIVFVWAVCRRDAPTAIAAIVGVLIFGIMAILNSGEERRGAARPTRLLNCRWSDKRGLGAIRGPCRSAATGWAMTDAKIANAAGVAQETVRRHRLQLEQTKTNEIKPNKFYEPRKSRRTDSIGRSRPRPGCRFLARPEPAGAAPRSSRYPYGPALGRVPAP